MALIRLCFIIFFLSVSLIGCSRFGPQFEPNEKIQEQLRNIEFRKPELSKPIKFRLQMPEKVRNIPPEIAKKAISINVFNSSLDEIVQLLQKTLEIPILNLEDESNSNDDEKSKKRISLSYKGELIDLLKILSSAFNVWVYYEDSSIKFDPDYILSFRIPLLLESYSANLSAEKVSVEAQNEHLKKLIENFCKENDIELVALSTVTGYVQVAARPRQIERFIRFMNEEVIEQSRFVSIQIYVLELTLNRALEKSFSLSEFIDFASETQGVIQIPSVSKIENQPVTVFSLSNEGNLSSIVRYVNSIGRTEIISTPTLVTANGIPAVLNLKKEVGWWLPGDVEDVSVRDNAYRVRQGRPTWESEEVGLVLVLRPRILKNKTVFLDIYFSNSEVYDFVSFEWQADPELEPVTLKKPVVSETEVLTRTKIRPGQYLLIAGLKRDTISENQSWPTLFNKSHFKNRSYLFLIISVEL